MNRNLNRIKSQSNTTNEVSYAIIQTPATTAFISAEIMERNEEKKSLRQTGKIVYDQSGLAENKKTERQEKKTGPNENMEGKTYRLVA